MAAVRMGKATQRVGLDVPPGLPHGSRLGRVRDLDRAIARYGEPLTTLLTEHALLGDDLGYAAYAEFKDRSVASNWRTLERALDEGIDAIEDPPPGLVALFEQLDTIPEWVDFDQLYRGAVAFWRSAPLVQMVLAWAAIGAGFSMYSSTRPVLFSGRLGDDGKAGKRLEESFRYVVAAYTPGGMDRYAPGFRLTTKVRMIHAVVRHALSHGDDWDWEAWGIPINNLDSMNTQAGQFGWVTIGCLQRCGVRFSDREIEDIFALSRYVGWVIGVPEEILHTGPEDALRKHRLHKMIEQPPDEACRKVINSIIAYSAESPPGDYEVLPGPVARFMTVQRRQRLAYGMLDDWLDRDVLDHLLFDRTAWRFVPKVMRPVVSAVEAVTRRLPHDDEAKTLGAIDAFNEAIGIADDRRDEELANPDTLSEDVAANKGKVRKPELAGTR